MHDQPTLSQAPGLDPRLGTLGSVCQAGDEVYRGSRRWAVCGRPFIGVLQASARLLTCLPTIRAGKVGKTARYQLRVDAGVKPFLYQLLAGIDQGEGDATLAAQCS